MNFAFRWSSAGCAAFLFCASAGAQKAKDAPDVASLEQVREELGVNAFTAPSIGLLIEELHALQPIPFEKVWRDLPDAPPGSRAQLALTTGGLIADGFLAVESEKAGRIEQVGRALLRLAKGLGVGERIAKHSRGISELALRSDWPGIKAELVRTQVETEAGMMALKDEEIAHLVSLGGWLRGLEITAVIAAEDYSAAKASRLVQPELLGYYLERTATLNPALRKTAMLQVLAKNLREIQALTTRAPGEPISLEEVKRIRDLAREMNRAISRRQSEEAQP